MCLFFCIFVLPDSTVRIWDIAAALPRSVRQISDVFAGEVVTSVDFGPTLLYATTESSLFAFDLRKTNEVLLKQVRQVVCPGMHRVDVSYSLTEVG
mgnify:CR=1 FL=1